ncbi:MAG TPA: FmdB family zinc ribbon protein [Vicinamibacterales bacterium]
MPLYEYQCENCGLKFEVIQKFSDPTVGTCRACGGKVQRLLSAPAIQFKGTGWYITDYARKGMTPPDSDKPSSSTGSSETSDKPAASAETKSPGSTPSTSGGTSSESTTGADKQ